ncbi:MAG TPA: BMP family ABC transporter substrate-binding protein [Acidimicrobiales bacterium]
MAPLLALAFIATACGNDDDDTSTGDDGAAEPAGDDSESCIGEEGCVPANQPDVNGDGTVKIGVLSPGDTNDNGYYESFVLTAREVAEEEGWELTILDKVNPADSAEQARNLCRQEVDMVAIAAGELADAIPVAEEEVCAGAVWYVAGGAGVEQTPYFFQTSENPGKTQFVTGYATGLAMEALGTTKAGYVTGPELDFSTTTFDAWTAGIKETLPDAETVATYTGDFDDSSLGQEAARTQLAQGVGILYPYLGGATDAVAEAGAAGGVLSITPGTDRCGEDSFAISSIFSPGDYFAAVLEDFKAGTVELGVTRMFEIGADPVPAVKVCPTVDGHEEIQSKIDAMVDDIVSGEVDVEAKIAG